MSPVGLHTLFDRRLPNSTWLTVVRSEMVSHCRRGGSIENSRLAIASDSYSREQLSGRTLLAADSNIREGKAPARPLFRGLLKLLVNIAAPRNGAMSRRGCQEFHPVAAMVVEGLWMPPTTCCR